MKTPTRSERLKRIADTALKKLEDSQKKQKDELEDSQKKQKDEIEALREEMEAAMLMDDEDASEIVQGDDHETDDEKQEPRQLFDDAPLKEEAVLDPKIVQDSPEAEELNQEVMAEDQHEGVHQEEDSFVSADHQSFNIPGQKTARKLSNRDAESTRKSFSQDARSRSSRGQLSGVSGEARELATRRMTDQTPAGSVAEQEVERLKKEIEALRAERSIVEPELDDEARVRGVRNSVGYGSQKVSRGYDRRTTVEAINSLDLLKGCIKSAGQNPELAKICAESVYPWIEACDKARNLEPKIFNDYYAVLISSEVWASIKAWNGARKEDKDVPGVYWPMKLTCNVIVGRAGMTDSTRATTKDLRADVPQYDKRSDICNIHGEGLRSLSWDLVCAVLRAMIAPKKKKDFAKQLELEASRRLSKKLSGELAAQKGPLKLVDGVKVSVECKAAMVTIKEAMESIQYGQRIAQGFHERGFEEIRYDGKDGHGEMIKSLLSSWKASHATNLHEEMHKPYPCEMVKQIREVYASGEAKGGRAPKIVTLDEYYDIYEAHWTYVYDLGTQQETTLSALGITFEARTLQAVEEGERLYTEDDVKQLKKAWKREADEKVRLAFAANEYYLQAVTAFNGKFGYKGTPICFREAGRMDPKDRHCDGLTKGGGPCNGHDNRNVEDWLAGLLYMIEQTERDQIYYGKRLDHLKALRKRIQKEGASAIPKFDAHPGRDRPLQQIGYVSNCDEEAYEEDDSGAEIDDDGHVCTDMNALESCSDSDSM